MDQQTPQEAAGRIHASRRSLPPGRRNQHEYLLYNFASISGNRCTSRTCATLESLQVDPSGAALADAPTTKGVEGKDRAPGKQGLYSAGQLNAQVKQLLEGLGTRAAGFEGTG